MEPIKFNNVEKKIITIRNEKVILDSDVAALYGVETKRINEALKNNPDKFPKGYVIELSKDEWRKVRVALMSPTDNKSGYSGELVEIFDQLGSRKHSYVFPKAFTEKGLYMLATILKSPAATRTTIAIVETFAQIRELSRTVVKLSETKEESIQKSLMQRSGEIIGTILDEDMKTTTDTETSIELNLALLKFKHIVKRKNE
ncbi:ORF6N domain protein [Bacteroidales bacterium Barb4]|nr:ORF6N domain protein [Bacteroidales bacterium Barb4]